MYAVLFDIDGTLLQTGGAGHVAFAEAFRDIFGLHEIPEGIGFAGRSDRAICQEIMERAGIDPTVENWQTFFDDYRLRLERVLDGLQGTVLPGVVDLLDVLQRDAHVALGLLTGNTEFGARAKTTAYGLADRFAFGGFGDVRTNRNDIAADALVAAQQFVENSDGENALCGTMVIGDTPADVECGRAIDAYVVAVATGGSTFDELAACDPDLLLADLSEPQELLAAIDVAKKSCLQSSARA